MSNNVRNKVRILESSYVIGLCYCEKESRRRWLRVDATHSAAPSGALFVIWFYPGFRIFDAPPPGYWLASLQDSKFPGHSARRVRAFFAAPAERVKTRWRACEK